MSKCIECMHKRVLHAGDVEAIILICENERSDHYGHVLNGSHHPTCKEYEILELQAEGCQAVGLTAPVK
ncbi:MAG: hypothetical protein JW944_07865 [Deltaproteobacteria bacterium]|nr:hypothetical protein [Deltaproteobacteria bacterium]